MLFDLFTNIITSIIIVVLLHYLYTYLKDTYTTKVEKDVAKFHHEKYQEILEELKKPPEPHIGNVTSPNIDKGFLPNKDIEELQSSLLEFVQTII